MISYILIGRKWGMRILFHKLQSWISFYNLTFALMNNLGTARPFGTKKILNNEVLHRNPLSQEVNMMDQRLANLMEVDSNQLKHLAYKMMQKVEGVLELIQLTLFVRLRLDL